MTRALPPPWVQCLCWLIDEMVCLHAALTVQRLLVHPMVPYCDTAVHCAAIDWQWMAAQCTALHCHSTHADQLA